MKRKILIVEDEAPIADILKFNLEKEGFDVECIGDGLQAIDAILKSPPDLLLLDIMLPGTDGIDVCRAVRVHHHFPIIMLTAKDTELDKVLGLEMGADDYMTKPFSTRELIARIRSNLRRTTSHSRSNLHKSDNQSLISLGQLIVDPISLSIKKQNKYVELTNREFDLLLHMIQNIDKVLTREHLLQAVWGFDYFGDARTVDVTVRRLREKIEDDPSSPKYIITRRGIGYTFKRPLLCE